MPEATVVTAPVLTATRTTLELALSAARRSPDGSANRRPTWLEAPAVSAVATVVTANVVALMRKIEPPFDQSDTNMFPAPSPARPQGLLKLDATVALAPVPPPATRETTPVYSAT